MPGPNFVLDKGYTCLAAVRRFRVVFATTTREQVREANAAGGIPLGVCQEEISADDATRGRVANIRIMGISRCVADAAIPIDTYVRAAADGRVTTLAAVTQNQNVVGRTTTASAAAGDHIDVILMPGVTRST